MMQIESTKILDREMSLAISKNVRDVASPVLREVINEGIRVFERCSRSARGHDENLGLLSPFLHLIEMLDGAEVALSAASTTSAKLSLRAAFEALLAVEWICQDQSLRYGAAYVVVEIHRRIASIARFARKHPRRKDFIEIMKSDSVGQTVKVPELKDAAERIQGLQKLLSKPHLKEAADEYERVKAKIRNPAFYALWSGPQKIDQLAHKLSKGGLYQMLYRVWSRTVHAEDMERQLGYAEGGAVIQVFRSGDDLEECYSFAIAFGLSGIRSLLGFYRPGELDGTFARWYSEHVRDVYMRLNTGNSLG